MAEMREKCPKTEDLGLKFMMVYQQNLLDFAKKWQI